MRNQMKETTVEFQKEVGARLREARKKTGMSQQQWADKMAVGRITVLKYENGQTPYNLKYLKKVQETFQVSLLYLTTGTLPVFLYPEDTIMEQLQENYGLSNKDICFLKKYISLTQEERETIRKALNQLSSII